MSSNTRKELELRIAELNCELLCYREVSLNCIGSAQINASTSKQRSVAQEKPEPQAQSAHKQAYSYSRTYQRKPEPKPSYRPRHMNMSLTNANSADNAQPPSWVSRRSGNMSLVTSDTLEKSLSIKASKEKEKAARRAAKKARLAKKTKQHQLITKDGRRQIIIDGVPFEFDETGGKLVKVSKEDIDTFDDEVAQQPHEDIMDSSSNTPKKMTIDGTNYVRTKSGNLVRDIFAKRRNDNMMKAKQERLDSMTNMLGSVQKARNVVAINRKTPQKKENLTEEQKVSFGRRRCPKFTKLGRCSKALHCPYVHDSAKTSICPHFLRKKCRNSDATCPLSHETSANNMPHCSHFESPHGCRAGDECIFTHVHLSKDAPVCRDFAVLGYCDKGADCDNRHVRECPDYSENGDCKNASCKLPHILKSEASKAGIIEEGSSVKRKEMDADIEEGISDHDARKKRFKKRKSNTDDLTQQSDFVTFNDSDQESSASSGGSDSDQESVNSDDFDLANESIPLY